jgi:hypothetical protein
VQAILEHTISLVQDFGERMRRVQSSRFDVSGIVSVFVYGGYIDSSTLPLHIQFYYFCLISVYGSAL